MSFSTARNRILDHSYEPDRLETECMTGWLDDQPWAARGEGEGDPYCIVIPPPNVTGALHMGHALNNTLQDILIRYHRMCGKRVHWQAGLDHAGIATQTVVERELRKTGLERREIGRDAFIERVWSWKEEYGGRIIGQLKRLGCSADWSRLRFTMDEHSSRAVREAFVRLYEEERIYRGTYLVNWCPACQTALSDLEVEMEERDGHLTEIHYPVEGSEQVLTVATTRPETMLGDSGVAVHPEDPRFRDLIGGHVLLPLVGRRIPIVGDAHVDPEFGTGVLKVTPAHDFNDAEIGERHGLEQIAILDEAGRIVEGYAEFSGLDRAEARQRVLQRLESEGRLGRAEAIRHQVGHCYRCRTVVEPHLSAQWFVRTGPLAERVLAELDAGRVRIVPDTWDKVLRQWLEGIRDWCISRQIWWGHRIPVWTCQSCGREDAFREDPEQCPSCGGTLEQDPDVLDTWFSSALWPFSTLGWPDETADLKRWYPNAALVTAFDILFFWVARMLMFGLHFRSEVPFADVVLHAIVRDEHGEKMSKTRGNVVDPLDVIAEQGADALRFTLASMTHLGRDIRLSPARIEGYRHFANKLWNAGRFVLRNLEAPEPVIAAAEARHPFNRWILSAVEDSAIRLRAALDDYAFGDYCQEVYRLAWDEFCDWYLEGAKTLLRQDDADLAAETRRTLATAWESLLRLLHPAMPFLTEVLGDASPLAGVEGRIGLRAFPAGGAADPDAIQTFRRFSEAVRAVRNIRGENGLPPTQAVEVLLHAEPGSGLDNPAWHPLLTDLARASTLRMSAGGEAPKFSGTVAGNGFQVWVPLAGLLDPARELERLDKLLKQTEGEVEKARRKLGNENFVARAPDEVVAQERERLAGHEQVLERTQAHIAMLRSVVDQGEQA